MARSSAFMAVNSGSGADGAGVLAGGDPAGERQVEARHDPSRPLREHHQPGRQKHRFLDVVGDENGGLGRRGPEVEEDALHFLARDRVERAERLVEQQHRRVGGQRAGEADALLHAAGKRPHRLVGEFGEADLDKQRHDHLPALPPADAAYLQREGDVLGDVEPGQQRVALEDNRALDRGSHDRLGRERALRRTSGE